MISPVSDPVEERKGFSPFPQRWPWVIEPTRERHPFKSEVSTKILQIINSSFWMHQNQVDAKNTYKKNRHVYKDLFLQPYICDSTIWS